MSGISGPPPVQFKAPTPEATLRRLFMTVFLRGQSARGITKQTAPKSVMSKLWSMLGIYALMGFFVIFLTGQSVLAISVTQHAMTFLMLGMFVASSSGEALFNKEESEILMHRPVTSQMILRAKAAVLVQISLYLACAINLVGMGVGVTAHDGGWLYPIAHAFSMVEEALFSIGVIVLLYQLCLRWFGRERLEGLMTTMQVLVIVCITVGSQILPRAIKLTGGMTTTTLHAWWFKLLPPAWFASFDDAVAGSGARESWILAGVGFLVTAFVLWLAFSRLAGVYGSGVQTLNESAPRPQKQGAQFRLVKTLGESAPLKWFLRNSVSLASFQLVAAYMFRDRDTKLRLYPGIAPMMIMPITLLFMNRGLGASTHLHSAQANQLTAGLGGFSIALSAVYMCVMPLTALNLLKFSQQWRAAEVFIAAPIYGPAPLLQGARVAVVFFLGVPLILVLGIFIGFSTGLASLWLILSGVIAMPVYAMIPGVLANATPLSNPIEEAKSMQNFPIMMLSLLGAFGIAAAASAAAYFGLLAVFLILEAVVSAALCFGLNKLVQRGQWRLYD